MSDQATRNREFHAFTAEGLRVFLGHAHLSDEEVNELLNMIAKCYEEHRAGVFRVKSGVFNTQAFVGVQITPPATT